jgi:hypothetical protein
MSSELLFRLRCLLRRAAAENDLDDELRAHIRDRAADLERSGLDPADALRRARLDFCAIEKLKE